MMSPLVSADKRDQYVEERRSTIVRAAVEVFGRKGYDRSNVADIAETAGIGKGTLYLYFKSKEDIFLAIVEEYSFVPQLLDLLPEDAPVGETLANVAHQHLNYMKQHSPVLRILVQEGHRFPEATARMFAQVMRKGNDALVAYLEAQVQAGRVRPLENPFLTARAIMGVLMSHVLTQEILGAKRITSIDDDAWINEVVTLVYNGIRP
jgi:AcrR family transcriptional regulator